MELEELERDYFATLQEDAEKHYEEEQGEYAPEVEGVDERALKDGRAFLADFHASFPQSRTEGGDLYIARIYDDSDLPADERAWLTQEDWYTDATATVGEGIDGRYWVFFE